MAGVIYSKQLANTGLGAGAAQLVYTVPASTVVVVTNVDTFVVDTATGQVSYTALESCIVNYHASVAADSLALQWAGRQVLTAGQTINVTVGGSACRVGITGYVLGP